MGVSPFGLHLANRDVVSQKVFGHACGIRNSAYLQRFPKHYATRQE